MVSGDDMLKTTVWAVAGDVLNSSKPAYKVVQKLRQHNKTVYLINQRDAGKKDNITNDIVYSSVDELADKYIETLDLCINPVIGVQLIQQARNANINNMYVKIYIIVHKH